MSHKLRISCEQRPGRLITYYLKTIVEFLMQVLVALLLLQEQSFPITREWDDFSTKMAQLEVS